MIVANGIDFTGASVAPAMKRIEALSRVEETWIDVSTDDDPGGPTIRRVLGRAISFIDQVTSCIRLTRAPISRDDHTGRAIGLTFGSGDVYGWVEFGYPASVPARRVNFGLMKTVLTSGMKQEVRVEFDVLFRLGKLLGDIPLGPQGEFDLRPWSSSKTTTPAAGGTGPAPVETASQPGCNPVNPAEPDSQQDRSMREREQSSSPAAPHGSPSFGPADQPKGGHHGQAEDFRHAAPPEHRVRR
jgi:hypothetical protein